jgi:hypothetical protein
MYESPVLSGDDKKDADAWIKFLNEMLQKSLKEIIDYQLLKEGNLLDLNLVIYLDEKKLAQMQHSAQQQIILRDPIRRAIVDMLPNAQDEAKILSNIIKRAKQDKHEGSRSTNEGGTPCFSPGGSSDSHPFGSSEGSSGSNGETTPFGSPRDFSEKPEPTHISRVTPLTFGSESNQNQRKNKTKEIKENPKDKKALEELSKKLSEALLNFSFSKKK